jgi:hypothetical protein
MRDLGFFQHRFAPVSTSIAFVNVAIDDIVPWWFTRFYNLDKEPGWTVTLNEVHGSLDDKLVALLPLNSRKNLVTETSNGGVAYFSNHPASPSVESEPLYWCEIFKKRLIWISCKNVKPTDPVGSVQFNFSDHSRSPQHNRGVAAYKDNRWNFFQFGAPLPFEDLEAYKAKKKKDRLTPEMVERYCQQFLIDPYDPDFYQGKGYIINLRPYPDYPALTRYPNQ